MFTGGERAVGQFGHETAGRVVDAQADPSLPAEGEPDYRAAMDRIESGGEVACEFRTRFFLDPGQLGEDEIVGGDLCPRGTSAVGGVAVERDAEPDR